MPTVYSGEDALSSAPFGVEKRETRQVYKNLTGLGSAFAPAPPQVRQRDDLHTTFLTVGTTRVGDLTLDCPNLVSIGFGLWTCVRWMSEN